MREKLISSGKRTIKTLAVIIVFLILNLYFCSFAEIPKLGIYKGPNEIRFTVFGVCGSTRALTGDTTVEFYTVGETPYTAIFTVGTSTVAEIGFWSQDVIPPARITNINSYPGGKTESISLQWKHPGDDHNTGILGTLQLPATYYIQYSPLTSVVWSTANAQITFAVSGKVPYTDEVYYILGSSFSDIYEGTTYYFRIWVRDSEGNLSEISLGTTNWATPATSIDAICVFFDSSTLTDVKKPKYKKWVEPEFYWTNYTTDTLTLNSWGFGKYVLRACPRRNEYVLAVGSEDSDNDDVEVQVYNGQTRTWGNLNRVSANAGDTVDYQPFDVAYEDNSGRAVVCYRDYGPASKTTRVYYQIWNGTTWSSGDIDSGIEVEAAIRFIRLVSKPGSNEILMAIQDANRNHYVSIWDGTTWSSPIKIGTRTASSSDQQCFDIAYEYQTKRAMIVFSSGTLTQPYYSLYDGATWSTPLPVPITGPNTDIRWIRLSADPSSDKMILIVYDNNRRISYAVWTGSSWTDKGLLADLPDGLSIKVRPFDVCWLGVSGKPMIVYSDNTYIPKYITGTNFDITGGCINIGAVPAWISLFSDNNSSTETVHLITFDTSLPNCAAKIQSWNGSQWMNLKTLSTKSYNQGCGFGAFRYDDTALPPDNIPPAAVTNLVVSTTTIELQARLTWTSPGDDGWSGRLVCGSQYRIQYSTWLAVVWSTANAQIIISTYNVNPYTVQTYLYTLPEEGTYYFRLWTRDDAFNWSGPSNIATGYFVFPPAAITDLKVQPSRWGRCIDLTWTSPGDDGWSGNIIGGMYKIRYSTYVLPDDTFWNTPSVQWQDFLNKFEILWSTNTPPLQVQFRRLTGLQPGVTYYIRIWTRDENSDGWSLISNAATSWAQVVIVGVSVIGYAELLWSTTYNFDWLQTNTSSIAAYGVIIENTGNVYEDYGLRINTTSMKNDYNTVWTIDNSSSVYYDRFVLEGVFYNLRPATTDYGTSYGQSDDVITDSIIWSVENTKYHPPYSSGQPENSKGVRVIPFEDGIDDRRKFWFRIHTPLATSTTDQQTVPVEFWAKENMEIGPPP